MGAFPCPAAASSGLSARLTMSPSRDALFFLGSFLDPWCAHRQRVGQAAAAALILALAALSIRLTLAPDLVARFSYMGYVGGLVMNAIAACFPAIQPVGHVLGWVNLVEHLLVRGVGSGQPAVAFAVDDRDVVRHSSSFVLEGQRQML
jgi:hypothetical protein